MDSRTAEALELSIGKWRANENVNSLSDAKTGGEDCPLCILFPHRECSGCPVAEHTGEPECFSTPYMSKRDFQPDQLPAFKKMAKDMREFLESLRETMEG